MSPADPNPAELPNQHLDEALLAIGRAHAIVDMVFTMNVEHHSHAVDAALGLCDGSFTSLMDAAMKFCENARELVMEHMGLPRQD